jgi:hypothetical protein
MKTDISSGGIEGRAGTKRETQRGQGKSFKESQEKL